MSDDAADVAEITEALGASHAAEASAPAPKATILVYSDDRSVRDQVRLTLGRRVASDLPEIEVVECATHHAVTKTLDAGGIDAVIMDGEATPAGGMGMCRQVKDEIANCPPVLLLVARVADAWLATWSRADAVVAYPIDPIRLPEAVAGILRTRLASEATVR
ncbi:MAG: response regulator [Propioniciclava sp.]|uniref:response regulator n=1 Tax=Propioniciclava sp. TaxID=2038686 RepID=UPI0039E4B45F